MRCKQYLLFFCCFFLSALQAKDLWIECKQKTVEELTGIPGWCSKEKALLMMEIIKNNNCQKCIEIGVFGGSSLFPIAKALQYKKSGIVYAIDAWDRVEAIRGFESENPKYASDKNYIWWNQLDYNSIYHQFCEMTKKKGIQKQCEIIRKNSREVASQFDDGTIDFIHFDGNPHEEYVFQDVVSYYPKVKEGGYLLLSDPNYYTKRQAVIFLMERAEMVSSFTAEATYFLFKKSAQVERAATKLFKERR